MKALVETNEVLFDLSMGGLILFFFLLGKIAVKEPRVLQEYLDRWHKWMDWLDASGNLRRKSIIVPRDIKVWGWFALLLSVPSGCALFYKYFLILIKLVT